jgi:hypothetical protein
MCDRDKTGTRHIPRCIAEGADVAVIESLDICPHDDPQLGKDGEGHKT